MSVKVAEFLLNNFKGREDWIAYAKPDSHFQPYQLKEPLTPEKFSQTHLEGDTCLGFYLLTQRNTVYCSCLDFDNHDKDNHEAINQGVNACDELLQLGFEPLLEVSQSGFGSHVWLIFDEELPAWLVRKFWQTFVLKHVSGSTPEIYPKQDDLKDKKLGNLIRYPLHNQSRFIQGYDQHVLSPEEIAQTSYKATEDDLRRFLENHGESVESPSESLTESNTDDSEGVVEGVIPDRVKDLITSNQNSLITLRWNCQTQGLYDGSYSGIMMSLATEFVRSYLPTEDIRESLEYWCRLRGYHKPLERPELFERTLEKAYEMVIGRREKKVLTGNTFDVLAHDYADVIYRNEDILIPTGIRKLDDSIGGFGFGELTVISGRPSQGKTALTLQLLDHASMLGFPCLLLSLEMSARENSRRFLLRLSDRQTDWKTETGNQFLHQKISDHFKNRAPIYFVEGTYDIERIDEAIDHYAQEYGVKLVALDYQGLADDRAQHGEYAKQTSITIRLKKAARRDDIAMISLVQMKRVEGDHPDREPQLSDLRATGEIEQSADLVLFNRWPWKDDSDRNKNDYYIWCKKSRNREIKETKVELFFESERQTIR